jgi:hypothetical protein
VPSPTPLVRFGASDPMASQVGTGTFWQEIIDQVTGRPADRVRRDLGRLADPDADPI